MAQNIDDLAKEFKGFQLMMQQMLDKMNGFEAWRTTTDGLLGSLLTKTTEAVARINQLEKALIPPPAGWINGGVDPNVAPSLGMPSSASPEPSRHSAGGGVLGPIPGMNPPPSNFQGMNPDPPPRQFDVVHGHSTNFRHSRSTPKMDFPKFDGEQPRLWREQCEIYFEIYGVSPAMMPKFVALNFTGAAALWLQTAQLRARFQTWEALQEAVCAHFDKDRYPLHMKQLENLKQTRTVTEYQVKFDQLAHSILLYNPSYDDIYFVTRFLSGLKDEI